MEDRQRKSGALNVPRKGDWESGCLGVGEKLLVAAPASREEEASNRKWRKPQECFQKGRLGERDQEECPDENSGWGEGKSPRNDGDWGVQEKLK